MAYFISLYVLDAGSQSAAGEQSFTNSEEHHAVANQPLPKGLWMRNKRRPTRSYRLRCKEKHLASAKSSLQEADAHQQNIEHGAAALPRDIWRIVASHMSNADWARASGTCKAMASVSMKNWSLIPLTHRVPQTCYM